MSELHVRNSAQSFELNVVLFCEINVQNFLHFFPRKGELLSNYDSSSKYYQG